MMKKKLALFCSHLAHLDPRIEWMADSLSKNYEVTIYSYVSYFPAGFDESSLKDLLKSESIYNNHNVELLFPRKLDLQAVESHFYARVNKILTDRKKELFSEFIKNLIVSGVLIDEAEQIKPQNISITSKIIDKLRFLFSFKVSLGAKLLWIKTFTKKMLTGQIQATGIPLFADMHDETRPYFAHFAKGLFCFEKNSNFSCIKYDKVYCADLDALLIGVLSKLERGIPLIYDAHEIYWASKFGASASFENIMREFEKLLIPYIDNFITVSPQIKQYYVNENKGLLKHCLSIPNACPLPKDANNTIVFLFQGSFSKGRGIEALIEIWNVLSSKRAHLVLRGPCDRQYLLSLKKLAGDNWNKTIFYKLPVKESELIEYAKDADVGLIPYPPTTLCQQFCSPNKLGQYMQAGCAILASNTEYVSEVIADAKAGLVYEYNSHDDLKDKIEYLINNPDTLRSYQFNAENYAEKYFNWDCLEKEMLDYIE
jgi:glycosyltransferase involved in cell wall biosynthesis